jgi:hypothetical protein
LLCVVVSQVLPDWAKKPPRGSQKDITAEETLAERGRLKAFMAKCAEESNQAKEESGLSKAMDPQGLCPTNTTSWLWSLLSRGVLASHCKHLLLTSHQQL